jgi:CBS domain-containing protein
MLIEEVIEFLQKVPPFQFLDASALKDITSGVTMEFYPKGTFLQYQGGPAPAYLHVIKKGEVKVSIKNENEEVFVDYRGEGDLIGYLLIFGGGKARANVEAIDDTICYLIKRETIQNLLYSNPAVREFFNKSFLTRYLDKTFKEIQNKNLVYAGGDKILFTMPVGELASKDVIKASENLSIQEAAEIMSNYRISALILIDAGGLASGIITDRDLRDKVVSKGKDCGDPVKDIMSVPYVRADVKEYCFEAILKMVKHNVHHLLVMKDNELTGILTNHDLMLIQGTSPLSIVKDIESQSTADALIPVSKKINNIVGLLLNEGAKASSITRIITEINDRLVKKILEIAEDRFGEPPVPYCWVVFGSEGRKEQTFKTDQDNALIYHDPTDAEMEAAADEYFRNFTLFVRDGLLKCGFPVCPADFMATNPMWRQPLHVWRKYFTNWISTPTAEAVLNSVTFFDVRAVYGETRLLDWLKDFTLSMAKDSKIFLGYIANLAIKNMPPIGFLKTFVVEKSGEHKDKLNMKIKGLAPLVDIVRLFALEKGIKETSTIERINALRDKHTIVKEYADELIHAFEFIMLLRIQHQLDQLKEGQDINNFINPYNLSNLEKRIAKETFQLVSKIQDLIIERYKAMIW